MIPRFKPFLGLEELLSLFKFTPDSVSQFESAFAKKFDSNFAIAFSYGRAGLWAFFEAMDIHDSEVILPAYTCSVVAHAIVLSSNHTRFVDINLDDYNMDLDEVREAINEKTRVIIATHLFGYPLNYKKLQEIAASAEVKYGQKIWIIQDCAHSFGAEYEGVSVASQPDLSLYGLNISKQITSIFGGMITTNNSDVANRIKKWRDDNFKVPGLLKNIRRLLYFFAVYPTFFNPFYSVVYFLQFKTSLLNYFTKAYHLDDKIHFPPDFKDKMLPLEAKVGLVQLFKYDQVIQRRRDAALFYHENISAHEGWVMPPLVTGATYSHYVIRVQNRQRTLEMAAEHGLQLGELIEYSIPESNQYKKFTIGQEFPKSLLCSKTTINLPIYASLSKKDLAKIVNSMNSL
jgi:perosamine synthetase